MSYSNQINADDSAAVPLGDVGLLGGGVLQNHGPDDVWLLADESGTPNVATVLSDGVKVTAGIMDFSLAEMLVLPTVFAACANGESADLRVFGQQS